MHQIEYNLSLTEAMLENMEPYLLSEEVYWPVASQPDAGSPPFPRLTLGGFHESCLLFLKCRPVQHENCDSRDSHTGSNHDRNQYEDSFSLAHRLPHPFIRSNSS